ncbi:hypothetical protein ACHAWF_017202 [Thalassiosira exigua]
MEDEAPLPLSLRGGGVKQLSKKLRPSSETPDVFSTSLLLHGKRIGIDLSVILHKSLGTEDGAGEFFLVPTYPNNEVIERCTRLCSYAKTNEITLVVSVDGMYHPMKEAVNVARKEERDKAEANFRALLASDEAETKTKEIAKLMKKAVWVSPEVIGTAVKVFREHGHEVYGAPYESDFQLVYWELSGFTSGTYTIDSDIFAMGSKLMVDLINFKSATGKCKILVREEVLGKVMEGSESWTDRDLILYSAISGCDFIDRLYRLEQTAIENLMREYKDPQNTKSLDQLLHEISQGRHWPLVGHNKAGAPATDFVEKVQRCIGLMTHAPVAATVDGQYNIVPLRPFPADKQWEEVIGFNPLVHFSRATVEGAYKLTQWARTGEAFPEISRPIDPNNSSRSLPHGAHIKFDVIPVTACPASVLRQWLFYRGVPQPKATTKKDLLDLVKHALELKQSLDEDAIASANTAVAKSYVPVDNINVLSAVEWVADREAIIAALRDKTSMPQIDSCYIDKIFGEGKNGIRERAWLRFVSGHLDIETLRMTVTRIKVCEKIEDVRIFEMKVTPSMKNVVYSVYVVVTAQGTYLPKVSKCDCPNGWLFCSHTLACFLIINLIQIQADWTFDDVVNFMPVPIKSLQSFPLAASYVFGQLRVSRPGSKLGKKKSDADYAKSIANNIASDIPGYSGRYKITDADAMAESKTIAVDLKARGSNVKSIDLCQRIAEKVNDEKDTSRRRKNNDAKVTIAGITSYNQNLVAERPTNKVALRKYHRHERLHRMMKDRCIPNESAMWHYIEHFKGDRARKIETLGNVVPESEQLLGPKSVDYKSEYLDKYFKDYDAE